MSELKKIKSVLISVYHKDHLEEIIQKIHSLNIKIFSTGGTKDFIEELGFNVTPVESLTDYPSIFGGRVKTLHPKVFGGILYRRNNPDDLKEAETYEIPNIDLVIVDLYPFEDAWLSGESDDKIIEKIDIGGISLIRAAAKNFEDVLVVPSRKEYPQLVKILTENNGYTSIDERKWFATTAFHVTSHYDTLIFKYFNKTENLPVFSESIGPANTLRYGENPHQHGYFYGDLDKLFHQIHGKELSYNNLLDIDAAIKLIADFTEPTFAILKHNNACGIASRTSILEAWKDALAGDPVSAFGGVLIANREIDEVTAFEINQLVYDIVIAPSYHPEAIELLTSRKKRIILVQKPSELPDYSFRSILNGVVVQDQDVSIETEEDMKNATILKPNPVEISDLLFANKIVKHSKSNAIVLVKNKQLIGSGIGQTNRVDALRQAIAKAESFGFELQGAVMASDAFFPFADCVEIAYQAGIVSVIQPGGSVKDNDSVEYCNMHNISMVMTGIRHFKH